MLVVTLHLFPFAMRWYAGLETAVQHNVMAVSFLKSDPVNLQPFPHSSSFVPKAFRVGPWSFDIGHSPACPHFPINHFNLDRLQTVTLTRTADAQAGQRLIKRVMIVADEMVAIASENTAIIKIQAERQMPATTFCKLTPPTRLESAPEIPPPVCRRA